MLIETSWGGGATPLQQGGDQHLLVLSLYPLGKQLRRKVPEFRWVAAAIYGNRSMLSDGVKVKKQRYEVGSWFLKW